MAEKPKHRTVISETLLLSIGNFVSKVVDERVEAVMLPVRRLEAANKMLSDRVTELEGKLERQMRLRAITNSEDAA